jgi:hypothetical protein
MIWYASSFLLIPSKAFAFLLRIIEDWVSRRDLTEIAVDGIISHLKNPLAFLFESLMQASASANAAGLDVSPERSED